MRRFHRGVKTGRVRGTVFKLKHEQTTYYGTNLTHIIKHLESNVVMKPLDYKTISDACGALYKRKRNSYKQITCSKITEPTDENMDWVDDNCVLIKQKRVRVSRSHTK